MGANLPIRSLPFEMRTRTRFRNRICCPVGFGFDFGKLAFAFDPRRPSEITMPKPAGREKEGKGKGKSERGGKRWRTFYRELFSSAARARSNERSGG